MRNLSIMAVWNARCMSPFASLSYHPRTPIMVRRVPRLGSSSLYQSISIKRKNLRMSIINQRAVHSSRKLLVYAVSPSSESVTEGALLPPKLGEIVKLFQSVDSDRARYEQLMHYGKRLKPLPKEYHTQENKVEGCVSQVWVRAYMDQHGTVHFEADSDSVLTKGLAALLVEGLSGCTPSQILSVTPNFFNSMRLNQSLTPSRNNGFLNMLNLMQRKALHLYMAQSQTQLQPQQQALEDNNANADDMNSPHNSINEAEVSQLSRVNRIRQKFEMELQPVAIDIEDVSHQHAGHAAMRDQAAEETHFNVTVVSHKFQGLSLVKRHRLVYDMLQDELSSGLHALSIQAKTPSEWEASS